MQLHLFFYSNIHFQVINVEFYVRSQIILAFSESNIILMLFRLIFYISERAISSKFKIQPSECKIERESDTGVCMFNYECYKKKGNTVTQ